MAIIDEKPAPLGRREHNEDASAKRVVLRYQDVDGDGEWYNWTPTSRLTTRYNDEDDPILYLGEASVGTTDASTGWVITRIDTTDPADISMKVATDVSWNNRSIGTYA